MDIQETSKEFKYTFSNDETIQLVLKTEIYKLFTPYYLYDIKVTYEYMIVNPTIFQMLGVVVKKTKNAVHIQCGKTHWRFPIAVCKLKPGIDVWISVVFINEKN
tara:strand:- start:608 stop:919 length:312 start_codon:yes stop_codon:yes gene_type:complete